MGSYAFSSEQNLAVQARLNFMLGSRLYDQLFLGFQCGELKDDVLRVFARSEYLALEIAAGYSLHVAIAVESVLKRSVKSVNVLPRGLLDSELATSAQERIPLKLGYQCPGPPVPDIPKSTSCKSSHINSSICPKFIA